jgi:hypothetical protein
VGLYLNSINNQLFILSTQQKMLKWGVMLNQATLQSEELQNAEVKKFTVVNYEYNSRIVDDAISLEIEPLPVVKCTLLNFDNLKPFEILVNQYQSSGVTFTNAIAILPSNPAFPANSGLMVLMGSPKNGFLEATFSLSVHFVSAVVTSSQQLTMIAYDQYGQILNQSMLPAANIVAPDATISPNQLLSVEAKDIRSVSFLAADGQFVIDDFRFCFF